MFVAIEPLLIHQQAFGVLFETKEDAAKFFDACSYNNENTTINSFYLGECMNGTHDGLIVRVVLGRKAGDLNDLCNEVIRALHAVFPDKGDLISEDKLTQVRKNITRSIKFKQDISTLYQESVIQLTDFNYSKALGLLKDYITTVAQQQKTDITMATDNGVFLIKESVAPDSMHSKTDQQDEKKSERHLLFDSLSLIFQDCCARTPQELRINAPSIFFRHAATLCPRIFPCMPTEVDRRQSGFSNPPAREIHGSTALAFPKARATPDVEINLKFTASGDAYAMEIDAPQTLSRNTLNGFKTAYPELARLTQGHISFDQSNRIEQTSSSSSSSSSSTIVEEIDGNEDDVTVRSAKRRKLTTGSSQSTLFIQSDERDEDARKVSSGSNSSSSGSSEPPTPFS